VPLLYWHVDYDRRFMLMHGTFSLSLALAPVIDSHFCYRPCAASVFGLLKEKKAFIVALLHDALDALTQVRDNCFACRLVWLLKKYDLF
jgi:hypothetical protein